MVQLRPQPSESRVPRPAPMFELIPYEKFATPLAAALFSHITVPTSNAANLRGFTAGRRLSRPG